MHDLRKGCDENYKDKKLATGTYRIAKIVQGRSIHTPSTKLLCKSPVQHPQSKANGDTRRLGKDLYWKQDTLMLIELCLENSARLTDPSRKKSGVFDQISLRLQTELNLPSSSNQCENRWTYLVRRYKDFIANKNQTGEEKL